MATKDKKSTKKNPETATKVTRFKASDSTRTAQKTTANAEEKPVLAGQDKTARKNPLVAVGGYFGGAWYELKQVRWPNRRATWSMTAAMLAFTAFFVVLVLLLDALFKYLFEVILG